MLTPSKLELYAVTEGELPSQPARPALRGLVGPRCRRLEPVADPHVVIGRNTAPRAYGASGARLQVLHADAVAGKVQATLHGIDRFALGQDDPVQACSRHVRFRDPWRSEADRKSGV